MGGSNMLVERTFPGKHPATLPAHRLLVHPLGPLVHRLDVLGQVGAPAEQFVADVALESFLALEPAGEVRVDELDVVAEVGGVGADPATGVAAKEGASRPARRPAARRARGR